ncbi:hypothetical protein C8J98_101433 [Luteibacter sp. OK325]|uniref:hypothetical protein n=1 Tax=Luteibacter sp. OK325 TaxID=2135670 RepID=UPI000D3D2B1D|nr:hypothetical protein [Luteibacter sp. OK325]PTR35170.1 hypothetical protein C8J98_101433 [Luteibacter sp. OK325]
MSTSFRPANDSGPYHLRAVIRFALPVVAIVAGAAPTSSHATRQTVDVISALIQEYSREGNSAEYLNRIDDRGYERYVLNRPGFPYADVLQVSMPEPDAPTRRAIASLSTPEYPLNHRDFHDMKVWDLGYTKSRVGREIPRLPTDLGAIPGASSLVKAGVDPDIYMQAIYLSGVDYPIIAANYALAAQILRAKLTSTPKALWAQHGLRHDVLDRFLHAPTVRGVYDYDLHYLIHVLDGAMSTWSSGSQSSYGLRELPTNLRVARIAAAYRERMPYEHEPCRDDRTYDSRYAGMGGVDKRPLCFDDATDRAVHAWYAMQFRAELSSIRLPRSGTTAEERMAVPLNMSRQGWIGIRRNGLIEDTIRLEVVEAKIADRLLADGLLSYRDAFDVSQRALRLACARKH